MKREQVHWVYLRSPGCNVAGTIAFSASFPKRTFFCYDGSPKERLAVKVVPMVTSYRENQEDLTPGRLGPGHHLDTGPPNGLM